MNQRTFLPLRLARRCLARVFADGPVRVRRFAELVDAETDRLACGVHAPESRSGILVTAPGDPFRYRVADSLLGQPLQTPSSGGKPRYANDFLAPSRVMRLYAMGRAGLISNEGLVYCRRTRTAVAETAALWDDAAEVNPLLGAPRFPRPTPLPGVSFSLLVRSAASYFHFLHDALPRLALLGDLHREVDHFIVNGPANGFASSWLAQAGVAPEKIVWATPLSHFACEQLLFTNDLVADQQLTPWTASAIRQLLGHTRPATAGKRWLWLSRGPAYARQFRWEHALISAVPGLEMVETSSLSAAAQMALFSDAAAIVGPHGAGFTNTVFCGPGVIQIELFPSFPIVPLYARWAQVNGARPYWAVVDFEKASAAESLICAIRALLEAGDIGSSTSTESAL